MSTLTGTRTLIRFIFRRDRVRVPVWIVSLLALVLLTAAVLPESFPTDEERQLRGELTANPAIRFLFGPGFQPDDYTFGAMLANEMMGMMLILVSLMSMFMISRHTRAEEETGRVELVRASAVGRHAGLTAALVATVLVNLAIGLLTSVGLPLVLSDLSWTGSLLFGGGMAATGIVIAVVAAIAAQIQEFSRAANGLAGAVLGFTYALRGFGDSLENAFAWVPPFGLAMQSAPYVYDRLWTLPLLLAIAVALLPAAHLLNSRRDVAAGLVRPKAGPPEAAPGLASPFGMAMRLQRGSFIGWSAGVAILAAGIGTIVVDALDLYAGNEMVQEMLESFGLSDADLIDSMLSVYISFFALVISFYTVGHVTRLRGEETSLRAENILATAVSRIRWVSGSVVYGLLTSVLLLALTGLVAGVFYAISSGDWGHIPAIFATAVVYSPALFLAAGVALLVFGIAPRLMAVSWLVPVYGVFVLTFASLIGLPGWMSRLSPFERVPRLPAADFEALPLLVMTLIAAVLILAGLLGLRRRDMDFT